MSKKLCVTMIGIQAIVHLSSDATDKLDYAILVAAVVIFYKLVQCRIDVMKSKHGVIDKKEGE